MTSRRLLLTPTDALLLLMTVIWAANYSIIKVALSEIRPLAFNSVRLAGASVLFIAAIAAASRLSGRRPAITPGDWLRIAALGVVGHTLYQFCFMSGIDRTTVSNTSLIFGCSPVTVGLLSAAAGHERLRALHWVGVAASVAGVYLLVGTGPQVSRASLTGDLLLICALVLWAIYSVGSRSLLERHTPLVVTGYSMAIGTIFYIPLGASELAALRWSEISVGAWTGLVFSAVFALFVAYLIWYTAVGRIGNLRTSMYSNVTPLVALVIAIIWLDERMTAMKMAGAAAILVGAGLTRLVASSPADVPAPIEK